jgi:hypothetical protein
MFRPNTAAFVHDELLVAAAREQTAAIRATSESPG